MTGWSDGGWEQGREQLLGDAWANELREAIGSDWGVYEYSRSLRFAA
ncbi:hypothetical protein ACIQF5_20570 [Streptomyces goshikiensis]